MVGAFLKRPMDVTQEGEIRRPYTSAFNFILYGSF